MKRSSLLIAALVVACSSVPDTTTDAGFVAHDAGQIADAGLVTDAGVQDAGEGFDAGSIADAGDVDAGEEDAGMVASAMPDFSLQDVNPASATADMQVSPRQMLGKISGWYFAHAT